MKKNIIIAIVIIAVLITKIKLQNQTALQQPVHLKLMK